MTAVPPPNATLHALLQKHGVKGTGDAYDLDGWQLRGGVAATIVGGRAVYVNEFAHLVI